LCVKGYNLKHFVTAMPGLFAHNLFNGLNTDVAECSVGKLQRLELHSTVGKVPNPSFRDMFVAVVGRWKIDRPICPTLGLLALTP
jgi:hypothetical protein